MKTANTKRTPKEILKHYAKRYFIDAMGAMAQGLFASLLITWIIGAVLTVIVYFKGRWHKRMIEKATPAPEFDV